MIDPDSSWNEVTASQVSSKELIKIMKRYTKMGLTLYVGTDSMLYSDYCTYCCIIAVHANDLNIANYYYQKQKLKDKKYKTLETKILKEVEISIAAAEFLRRNIADVKVEIHVDIGDRERNATRHLVDLTRGWITNMGYDAKIKPDSWASSVADWHTK